MNAIELSHVTKHFPGFTLQDLSLTVPSGTICGLVGEDLITSEIFAFPHNTLYIDLSSDSSDTFRY